MTINDVEPLLVAKAIRGSKLYNLAVPTSDTDIHGIYRLSPVQRTSLFKKSEQVTSDDNNLLYYELRRYVELAMDAGSSVLELLWTPADKLLLTTPVFEELRKHRDLFLTKKAYYTHSGYAYAQLKKARGQNKKVHGYSTYVDDSGIEALRRFYLQGQISRAWLEARFCVDFADFVVQDNDVDLCVEDFDDMDSLIREPTFEFVDGSCKLQGPQPVQFMYVMEVYSNHFDGRAKSAGCISDLWRHYKAAAVDHVPNCWRLYLYPGGNHSPLRGSEIVCSSIPVEDESRVSELLFYNKDAYEKARKEYRQYWEWRNCRNDDRWLAQENGESYDAKNMMHMCRLMMSCRNIVVNGEPRVVFDGSEQMFLMAVRQGSYSFDWLMKFAEDACAELDELYKASKLPQGPDKKAIARLYEALALM